MDPAGATAGTAGSAPGGGATGREKVGAAEAVCTAGAALPETAMGGGVDAATMGGATMAGAALPATAMGAPAVGGRSLLATGAADGAALALGGKSLAVGGAAMAAATWGLIGAAAPGAGAEGSVPARRASPLYWAWAPAVFSEEATSRSVSGGGGALGIPARSGVVEALSSERSPVGSRSAMVWQPASPATSTAIMPNRAKGRANPVRMSTFPPDTPRPKPARLPA